jgi:O-antigen/teichoic acid export membrane protein
MRRLAPATAADAVKPAALADASPGAEATARPALSRLVVMAIRLAAMVLNFAVMVALARVMGLAEFGTVNVSLALLSILVIPAAFGYETAAIRFTALGRDDGPLLRSLSLRFARTVALTSLLTCLAVGVAAGVEQALGNSDSALGLALLIPILPCFAFVRVGEAWLRGVGMLTRALVSSGVILPLLTLVFAFGAWLLGGRGHSVGIAEALGARALATAVALVAVGTFVFGKLQWRLQPRRAPDPEVATEIHRTALVLCGVSALAMFVIQADIVAVSFFDGSASAGIYSAAARITQATNVALLAVNFVLSPHIARLAANGETARLQREVGAAATWSARLIAVAFVVALVGSPVILDVFGPGFDAGANALRILMAGQLFNAFCGPAAAALTMSGGQLAALRILAFSVLVQVVLFALLIPPFGLVGAACSTVACGTVANLGFVYYARRTLGIWSLPTALVRFLP